MIAPGEVGKACDVRYTRDSGANVSVPYHADNSQSFCLAQAKQLAENLTGTGFFCSAAPSQQVAAVQEPVLETVTPVVEQETAHAAADNVQPVNAGAEGQPTLEDQMNQILAEPALVENSQGEVQEAVRGPAQLTAQLPAQPVEQTRTEPVGRLVGASPNVEQADAPRTVVEPVAVSFSQSDAPVKTEQEVQKKTKTLKRKPGDIVKATLMAQAAAWNEGNLEAFMATYAKSDDLKLIADGKVSKGWPATMKYYRDHYADDNGLGYLGFDKLDVELVTEDVAVVTGRFNFAKGDQASNGRFSLVMRQDEGRWRIVHDHSETDSNRPE